MLVNPLASGTLSKSECTAVAIDIILRCRQRLQKLEKTLEQCSNSPSGNTLKSKFQINQILYPFRRETMMTLVETISGLQANLDTALYMLNLDMGIENEKQMSIVVSNSASTVADTGQVLDLVRGLDQKHADFDGKLVMLENRMIQMESSFIRHRNQPILEPALLRSLVENQQKIDEQMRNLATMAPKHCDGCQTGGAGGFAISPNLALFPVVPKDSPVFSLLMNTEKTLGEGYDDVVLQDTLKGLLKLFRNHESSPLDTLPNGDTILHFVYRWHFFAARWDNPSLLGWRAFLSNLLRIGLPTNTINDRGETPVDALLQSFIGFRGQPGEETTIRICSDLFHRGGYMTPRGSRNIIKLNQPGSFSIDFCVYEKSPIIPIIQQIAYQRDLEGGVDIPEELAPLTYRSEDLLNDLLRKGINLRWTLNYYTQWPKGLALLLQAGYVPNRITFLVAVDAKCSESVKLLTQTKGIWLEESNLIDISDNPNEEITKLVVQEFVNCRKRLQALAEIFLSSTELTRLKVQSGRLLGFQAAEAYRLLKKQSIEIDYTETPTGWLVYNSVGRDLELATRLWDAGFRDVDELNDNGETCLMQLMWGGFLEDRFRSGLEKGRVADF
ncbi:hypothetical protein N7481_001154 [Penicillium waksmanii]|uniref:uncharacterized protein n=1 Tax=Penicillium waksmanii TaxID=69791 RepID=UPI0025494282|nr:uncharacterized protein N7481_001154 [Penicillium waksmanii]KAJ6000745.1 hypothetical protein N7481_001154 [Penicillium waksmanii]